MVGELAGVGRGLFSVRFIIVLAKAKETSGPRGSIVRRRGPRARGAFVVLVNDDKVRAGGATLFDFEQAGLLQTTTDREGVITVLGAVVQNTFCILEGESFTSHFTERKGRDDVALEDQLTIARLNGARTRAAHHPQ